MELKGNQNVKGLNLDSVNWQVSEGQLTWALNANIQSQDGNTFTYTNEMSNQVCVDFNFIKPGFKVIGLLNIVEQDRVVIFLVGPDGKGEIGVISSNNKDCLELESVETDCGCVGGKVKSTSVNQVFSGTTTVLGCPEGFTFDPPSGKCKKIINSPATIVKDTYELARTTDTAFGFMQPVLYEEGWNILGYGGDGTYNNGISRLTPLWWRSPVLSGRVNTIAVKIGSGVVVNTWLSFTTNICIAEEKVYYLAISADNAFRAKLDGVMILDPTTSALTDVPNDDSQWRTNVFGSPTAVNAERISYGMLHIYPVRLTAGNHTLEIGYLDYGNPQMVAAEIYDNTASEITNATSIDDLTVIWTTENQTIVESVLSVSCPSGFTLGVDENCTTGCLKVEEVEQVSSTVPTNTCCEYKPILVDECCEDCCKECVVVVFGIENIIDGTGSGYIEYKDCNGALQTALILGGNPIQMLKDSWRVVSVNSPNTKIVVTAEVPATSDCSPCLNPSPENCCLNFDMDYPIYATYRADQCETRVYFVDRKNPPRYLSLEFPLNRDACGESQDCGGQGLVTKASCGELNIFPETCHPDINPVRVSANGQLKAGVYQFAIAYTDEEGAELTDYFDFSRPIPIFEKKLTNLTDYVTNYSITVQVDHRVNIFEYFNLAVAETIQGGTTNYHLIGNYRVSKQSRRDSIIYTGEYKSSFSSILPLIRTPYYKTAGIVENQNDLLMLADLEKEYQYNFQPLANKLKLRWETVKMPYGDKWDYANPEIAYFFRTYQRDEVYAFGIKFKLKTGKYTEVFHIPGRGLNVVPGDDQTVFNDDVFFEDGDCNDPDTIKRRWEVYNTGGTGAEVISNDPTEIEKQYNCAIFNDKVGEFAYWESTELYPCNEDIWDTDAWGNPLAGKPIRFHKFPDSEITHIHDGQYSEGGLFPNFDNQVNLFPVGVRIDEETIESLINDLDIANPSDPSNPYKAKDLICGFELVYASRVGHKSVIAKGLLYDVGLYKTADGTKEYHYPNYPFNDINWRGSSTVVDPYLKTDSVWYQKAMSINSDNFIHHGFVDNNIINYKHKRFTFHSPDTHFTYPKVGTELKLETLEVGRVRGHFVEVEEHSKIKLFTNNVNLLAGVVSVIMGSSGEGFDSSNYFTDLNLFRELIEKFTPKVNFAWQYNGVGKYNGYMKIPNTGNKRRAIRFGNYAPSEILTFGQGEKPFHNRYRETSVYLSLEEQFDHHYPTVIDNSRYTAGFHGSQNSIDENPTDINDNKTTRAYYGSIKSVRPNQYGPITNLRYLSTGYSVDIETDSVGYARLVRTYYPAFGGDTFINGFALKRKHAFYRNTLAGKPDDIAFNYYLFPNLGYPTYFYGYQQSVGDIERFIKTELTQLIALTATAAALAALAVWPGGTSEFIRKVATEAGTIAAKISLLDSMGDLLAGMTPYLFLDQDKTSKRVFYHDGMIYLYSYGIPVFFVESDVNVDFRHGRNDREENFYSPKELGEIPDQWLQEVNVPIKFDNFYHYNMTYSVQNVINPNFVYNEDFPELYCETDLYNRVIYSDTAGRYGKGDPWLNFRRLNFYDFPKSQGRLIALNGIESGQVYARFENNTKVYNAVVTLDSNNPLSIEIGNASMFDKKPLDMSIADIGYLGSQHKAYIKTTHGGFWVDARRGHVYQSSGRGTEEISLKGAMNWFKENLPFQILKDFPNFFIDNSYNGIGIALGWDERYHRLFLTKLDYRVKPEFRGLITQEGRKLFYQGVALELGDTRYFENKSWTMAYSVILKSWISFYSFLPNNYLSFISHFQTVTKTGTWNHNLSPLLYQTYYNKFYPYIIEFPVISLPNVTSVNSVTYYQDIQKYYTTYEYYSLGSNNDINTPNFTKAIIYNKEQTSGVINLIPQVVNNARQKLLYPRVGNNAIDVLVSKREHRNSFNGFWDSTNSKRNQQNLFSTQWTDTQNQYPIDKVVNPSALLYTTSTMGKQKIKSTFCKVRLIQDKYNRYKFINNMQFTQLNNSLI